MADGHIQKHLHSMFHLLRPEETLKMVNYNFVFLFLNFNSFAFSNDILMIIFFSHLQAVKLESARYGRTRYLVVVSCSRKPTQRELSSQQNLHLMNAQNINNNNQNNNNSNSLSSSNINTINNNNNNRKSIGLAQQQQQPQHTATSVAMTMNATAATTTTSSSTTTMLSGSGNLTSSSPTFVKSATKILINGKDVIGDGSGTTAAVAVASMQHTNQIDNKNNCNEIEESCLLGIDCNEKTTVGLVLRILGDTAIRLDGDG